MTDSNIGINLDSISLDSVSTDSINTDYSFENIGIDTGSFDVPFSPSSIENTINLNSFNNSNSTNFLDSSAHVSVNDITLPSNILSQDSYATNASVGTNFYAVSNISGTADPELSTTVLPDVSIALTQSNIELPSAIETSPTDSFATISLADVDTTDSFSNTEQFFAAEEFSSIESDAANNLSAEANFVTDPLSIDQSAHDPLLGTFANSSSLASYQHEEVQLEENSGIDTSINPEDLQISEHDLDNGVSPLTGEVGETIAYDFSLFYDKDEDSRLDGFALTTPPQEIDAVVNETGAQIDAYNQRVGLQTDAPFAESVQFSVDPEASDDDNTLAFHYEGDVTVNLGVSDDPDEVAETLVHESVHANFHNSGLTEVVADSLSDDQHTLFEEGAAEYLIDVIAPNTPVTDVGGYEDEVNQFSDEFVPALTSQGHNVDEIFADAFGGDAQAQQLIADTASDIYREDE